MYRWWPALGIRISAVGTDMVLRACSPAFQSIQSLSPSKKMSIKIKVGLVIRGTHALFDREIPSPSDEYKRADKIQRKDSLHIKTVGIFRSLRRSISGQRANAPGARMVESAYSPLPLLDEMW